MVSMKLKTTPFSLDGELTTEVRLAVAKMLNGGSLYQVCVASE